MNSRGSKGARAPPLFLDRTEVQRAKDFPPPPPYFTKRLENRQKRIAQTRSQQQLALRLISDNT